MPKARENLGARLIESAKQALEIAKKMKRRELPEHQIVHGSVLEDLGFYAEEQEFLTKEAEAMKRKPKKQKNK